MGGWKQKSFSPPDGGNYFQKKIENNVIEMVPTSFGWHWHIYGPGGYWGGDPLRSGLEESREKAEAAIGKALKELEEQ